MIFSTILLLVNILLLATIRCDLINKAPLRKIVAAISSVLLIVAVVNLIL